LSHSFAAAPGMMKKMKWIGTDSTTQNVAKAVMIRNVSLKMIQGSDAIVKDEKR
jgi:hypothetical protein